MDKIKNVAKLWFSPVVFSLLFTVLSNVNFNGEPASFLFKLVSGFAIFVMAKGFGALAKETFLVVGGKN